MKIVNTEITTSDVKLETLSDKYRFVNTKEIAQKFKDMGFKVDSYTETRVRKASRQGNQKHQVRLSHPTLLKSSHEDLSLQLMVTNSSDGLSSFRMELAILRKVCSNGLCVSTQFEKITMRHTGMILEQIDESVLRIVAQVDKLNNLITAMKNVQLTSKQRVEFMEKAIKLRYPTKSIDDVEFVTHREEDKPLDAFTFLNHIQENLIRGQNQVRNDKNKKRSARAITNITTSNLINTGIFTLAEQFVTEAVAA